MSISGPKRLAQDPRQKKLYAAAGAGLAVLIVAALGVVFVLPATLQTEPRAPDTSVAPAIAKAEPAAPAPVVRTAPTPSANKDDPQARARKKAENLLRDVLRKQAELESDGVKTWGTHKLTTSYPDVLDVLAGANAQFDNAAYSDAAQGFQQAITLLETLAGSKDDRYRLAVAEGNGALASENADSASAAFGQALALRPGDPLASAGLARAQSLPDVLTFMEQGRRLDLSGDLDGAFRAYRGAADLDPAYLPAQEETRRTGELITDRDYRRAVSDVLRAIDDARFNAAEKALVQAGKLRPGTPEIRDIGQRLQQKRQAAAIVRLSRGARLSMRDENWLKAKSQYERILAIDRTVADAAAGLERADRMVQLHRQIALYLDDPDRLSSNAPLDHARQVLRSAKSVSDAGPRLTEETSRLENLIAAAEQPRPVVLKSDGETAVTIYRVARFGTFRIKRLELRPGKYTAVGSRPGFRDVRVEFRVSGTGVPTTLVVQCLERI